MISREYNDINWSDKMIHIWSFWSVSYKVSRSYKLWEIEEDITKNNEIGSFNSCLDSWDTSWSEEHTGSYTLTS